MPTATFTPLQTSLATRFRAVRAATMALVAPLSPEDMMVQSSPDASPVKWHLAHTTWFFETFLLTDYLPGYKPFHPDFHWLFNSYYNSLGDMPAKSLRASFSRPPLADILAYRTHVDDAIERLLAQPVTEDVASRTNLGFHHEQQHLELIATDIKHALFTNPLHPGYTLPFEDQEDGEELSSFAEGGGPASRPAANLTFTTLTPPSGLVEIGVNDDPEAFAFDNETPRHPVFLRPFQLADRLVTCAEYLAFLNDNAYTRPELWLSEGWSIMRAEGWQAPLYWQRATSSPTGWSIYTLHGFAHLSEQGDLADTPVCHLSFFEADAYARWANARLPTEFEWEYAATTAPNGSANMLETANLHPTAAPATPGLQQLLGDAWEWTSSGYTGYPGYKPLPGALGEYNGKFMSSQVVLRGGSCVTPATHIRATYRNFFPPATRWQFSGLRLAKDA